MSNEVYMDRARMNEAVIVSHGANEIFVARRGVGAMYWHRFWLPLWFWESRFNGWRKR